jgi:hypothetical protein
MDDETAIWHVFYFIFSFGMNSIGSLTGGNTTQREKNPMPMQRKQHFQAFV